MQRRAFLATSLAPALAGLRFGSDDFRSQFPRLRNEIYINAASIVPLGEFAAKALERGMAFQTLGPADGRGAYVGQVQDEIRGLFAQLVGASEDEVGLVHCTKAGEQIAIDGVASRLRAGGNIVTNDLHFTGSLHNLLGLRRSGVDVRIIKAIDWRVDPSRMVEAIDRQTALVCVSLVSNINGHVEDIATISRAAQRNGALVYADIIQAAGAMPVDVKSLGVDIAAANGYKHLYGVHGAGFLFVSSTVQGTEIPDSLFPGSARHNYSPWVDQPNPDVGEFSFHPRTNATRYQPGHVNYIGYCAGYEAMKILVETGTDAILAHSANLNNRLIRALPDNRYRCITPAPGQSPIVTFIAADPADARERLTGSDVVVTLSGNRIRVSPTLYNNEDDVDRLVEALME